MCKISIALSIEINGFLTNELNDTFCEHQLTDLNRFSSLFHKQEHQQLTIVHEKRGIN